MSSWSNDKTAINIGYGKMPKTLVKGSKEAKERMAYLRSLRGKKGGMTLGKKIYLSSPLRASMLKGLKAVRDSLPKKKSGGKLPTAFEEALRNGNALGPGYLKPPIKPRVRVRGKFPGMDLNQFKKVHAKDLEGSGFVDDILGIVGALAPVLKDTLLQIARDTGEDLRRLFSDPEKLKSLVKEYSPKAAAILKKIWSWLPFGKKSSDTSGNSSKYDGFIEWLKSINPETFAALMSEYEKGSSSTPSQKSTEPPTKRKEKTSTNPLFGPKEEEEVEVDEMDEEIPHISTPTKIRFPGLPSF